MNVVVAPEATPQDLYAAFEQHRDRCSVCTAAPTAHDYCAQGLALLDAALGDVGLASFASDRRVP